jgi:hypothetical protein
VRIRQGTTKPDLVLTLPASAPLLDTAFRVEVVGQRGGMEVFRADAAAVDGRTVTHLWQEAHTEFPGDMSVAVDVSWTETQHEWFPVAELVEVYAVGVAPLVSVPQLIDHMSGITLDESQRADAAVVLAGVQRQLERSLHRRFAEAEVTETIWPDPYSGYAMLARTPVRALLEVNGELVPEDDAVGRITPSGIYVYGLTPLGSWYPGAPPAVTIRYRGGGGLDPDDLADIELAILEKAARIMGPRHDDARSVKDLDTREPAPPADREYVWTSEELDTWGMSRLRRKVVA